MTTTRDIREYLVSNSPWVNPSQTVDTVKAGDPFKEIRKAGVCWYADLKTLQRAHEDGCNLLVMHEPLFWDHLDRPDGQFRKMEPGLTKQAFLQESGLVVLRAHDSWDQWPEIGIRDSWAKGLGLTDEALLSQGHNFHGMYRIPEQPLKQFAEQVAKKIAVLGEDSVQVIGDPERLVSRPALGVGCIGPDHDMVKAGADVIIVCYDGAPYWMVRQRLAEMGAAVITVEHGSSEMWGLENLSRHLAEQFPDVEFVYYAEHQRTWTVRPA